VIEHPLQEHGDKNNLMQIDQRGGKATSMNIIDNPLIDGMILQEEPILYMGRCKKVI